MIKKHKIYLLVVMAVLTAGYFKFNFLTESKYQLPQFSDYRVSELYSSASASSIFAEMGYGWLINNTDKYNEELPVFAGHYAIIEYACGWGKCTSPEIIDLNSKTKFDTDTQPLFGTDFRSDSRLLIVNPFEAVLPGNAPNWSQKNYDESADEVVATRYYELRDGQLYYLGAYRIIDGVLKSCTGSSSDRFASGCTWQ